MKRFNGVFVSLIVLTIFMVGGCSENNEDEAQRVEKCEVDDIIRVGEYLLVNGDYAHPGYTQCLVQDPQDQSTGWFWAENSAASEPTEKTASAYIYYGEKGYGTPRRLGYRESTTPNLPILVNALSSLSIAYDVEVSTTSRHRLAFDTSYYSCLVGSCLGASLIIEVYSDAPEVEPSAPDYSPPFQQRAAIDGEVYDFYKHTDSFQGWSVYWFKKVSPSHAGILYIHHFLNFLADEGYDSSDQKIGVIPYIRFFQESWGGGSGSTTIRTYEIDVTPRIK